MVTKNQRMRTSGRGKRGGRTEKRKSRRKRLKHLQIHSRLSAH